MRPLEPDTVSTVEGRNSHPMTVPSFDRGGAVFLLWAFRLGPLAFDKATPSGGWARINYDEVML